jgi:hydroxyacylglutathione hydrolase
LVKLLNESTLQVYGGDDRIPALTHKVQHDDLFTIGSLNVRCLFTPCHTTGHICYFVESNDDKKLAVFTGDTLFIAGCGRFFEGTAEQMYNALVKVLASLPKNTVNNIFFFSKAHPHPF